MKDTGLKKEEFWLPTLSDMLLCYSSLEGTITLGDNYIYWLNWAISHFQRENSEEDPNLFPDFVTLLSYVGNRISDKSWFVEDNTETQGKTVTIESRPTKSLLFNDLFTVGPVI